MKKQVYLYVNGLSDLGSRMHLIAVTALLLTFENPAFWLMAFFVARQVGGLLSSVVAGIVADRYDRRRLMMISDIVCGSALTSIVLMPHPLTVVLSAFLLGVFYHVFQVSYQASIPEWFADEGVKGTNARIIRLESLAGIIGFTAGGVLADQLGYEWVILFDAGTFFLSAIVLRYLRWNSTSARQAASRHLFQEINEAITYVKHNRFFLYLMIIGFLYTLGGTSWNYGLPILSNAMEHPSTMHGLMWSAVGAGSFAGSLFWGRIKWSVMSMLVGSMVCFSGFIVLAFSTSVPILILLALFLAGLFDSATALQSRTLLQQSANELRGRIMGFQSLLTRFGFLLGFLVAPMIVATCSVLGLNVLIHSMLVVAMVILYRPMKQLYKG
ncbi:MFS transporter [Brevibacillus sp. SYSU BS000544]|uniref:MFS transporter n=1 Tax=Brevibacillus sp. SYSU BS000544 TaxID=3416443 RepID=UPI003CE5ABE0